ncbi:MAG: ATP phosphoribosyltransferase regulatory subunit, partial [Lachnospiraceae bacterium]|nr:ATP phosphoribosyltransferase regulatory subunit [Lachnospiraceae bacterium]
DRQQNGRFRQFYQCDIDILGEAGNLAEIELILATTTLLGKLGFTGFTVHINDRRILKAMAAWSGFPEDSYDQVFITLDKMDKIGPEGVAAELTENGFAKEAVDRYLALFAEMAEQEDAVSYLGEKLADVMEPGTAENLKEIVDSVTATTSTDFNLQFDPTLVRGMSYYTGTIFEIEIAGLGCSAGGGGRYDEMVGKFTNMKTPACGFSIGFERIITILLDQGFQVPGTAAKQAFLLEKNMPADRLCAIMKEAQTLREQGTPVLVSVMNKNKKFQKEQLAAQGYTEFREFYVNPMR